MRAIYVKRTGRTGHGVGDDIIWEAMFPSDPSEEDVKEAQKSAGYHPAGYGGPSKIIYQKLAEGVRVTWRCFASCD